VAFYLSPLVDIKEIDVSTTIGAAATSIAAIVIRNPQRGQEMKRVLVTDSDDLVERFGIPSNVASNYEDMLSAEGFLKYGRMLYCTGVRPGDATFAGLRSLSEYPSGGSPFRGFVSASNFKEGEGVVGNQIIGETDGPTSDADTGSVVLIEGDLFELGAHVDNREIFPGPEGVTFLLDDGVIFVRTEPFEEGGETYVCRSFEAVPGGIIDEPIFLENFLSKDVDEFAAEWSPEGTMDFICAWRGDLGNNIRVAVVDSQRYDEIVRKKMHQEWPIARTVMSVDAPIEAGDGKSFIVFVSELDAGARDVEANWRLREFFNVSTDELATDDHGRGKYAETVINTQSKLIRVSLGAAVKNTDLSFTTQGWARLTGGSAGGVNSDLTSQVIEALDLYENPEEVDVNVFIESNKTETVKNYINSICIDRKDSMGVLDCRFDQVVYNKGNEMTALVNYRRGLAPYVENNLNINSDKVCAYANWLEVYDRWNKKYRWIPASGYVAGIFAHTDSVNDPWFAPAGPNRGILTGVRRLAWNPNLAQRNILYLNGWNPIVSFSGQGKMVYGQKTMLDKNSSFNRINVRRLFNVIEKAIATEAKYFLFEPNDARTRMQMVNMVVPFLRDVKARRGIDDFQVICDERNNTPERVDRNELWMDIIVKPTKAAEYIILRFTNTKSGAAFEEVFEAGA
jgi:hypothetical protein